MAENTLCKFGTNVPSYYCVMKNEYKRNERLAQIPFRYILCNF
jgi:hypothetical protein